MHVRRSTIRDLAGADAFQWLAGIEDTFITAPSARTGRTLDEYELTGHYDRQKEDIGLLASLGLRAVRYGIPWHRINPARDTWDFRWADEPLEQLLDHGIAPVVDLVHYGLPAWIENAFLHPDYPEFVAEYAARIAERFKGRIHTYTPLNEPRITAWYCGRLGWWPPYRRSLAGFVAVLLAVCRGIVRTSERLYEVDPEIACVHVDATDLYRAASPVLTDEAARRQAIVFLALDLVGGHVDPGHSLFEWLLRHGASANELQDLAERSVSPDLLGINLYPMFSDKLLVADPRGRLRVRMPWASADIVERLADLYWQRYQVPLFISETAADGSVSRRARWLDDSVRAVARARVRGVPLIGYTWWPLFALVTWGYREGRKEPAAYLRQMGLWDLVRQRDGTLERVPTELVERFRALVAGGDSAVGRIAPPASRFAAQENCGVP